MTASGSPLDAARRAEAAADLVLAGGEPDPGDLALLARLAKQVLAGSEVWRALGLPPDWRAREARQRRDALIRELAGHYRGSGKARAESVALALREYGGAGWPLDRRAGGPRPYSPRRDLLFKVYSLDGKPPTAWRQLYNIITA